jgi:hypothetical protein
MLLSTATTKSLALALTITNSISITLAISQSISHTVPKRDSLYGHLRVRPAKRDMHKHELPTWCSIWLHMLLPTTTTAKPSIPSTKSKPTTKCTTTASTAIPKSITN